MADLKRDMAILATSGHEWADRTRRLAARVPDLDLFSQGLVERLIGGWRITDKGRALLDFMEARPVDAETELGASAEIPASEKATPRLLASTRVARARRLQRRRAAREKARAQV